MWISKNGPNFQNQNLANSAPGWGCPPNTRGSVVKRCHVWSVLWSCVIVDKSLHEYDVSARWTHIRVKGCLKSKFDPGLSRHAHEAPLIKVEHCNATASNILYHKFINISPLVPCLNTWRGLGRLWLFFLKYEAMRWLLTSSTCSQMLIWRTRNTMQVCRFAFVKWWREELGYFRLSRSGQNWPWRKEKDGKLCLS